MPDPSFGIHVNNGGGFVCKFRVKTTGKETPQSGSKSLGFTATWSYDELLSHGFAEGDNCWVSCDIEAGETNHESGGNFILSNTTTQTLTYVVTGGVWTPSWDGPSNPAPKYAVRTYISGGVLGRTRVKTNGKETDQSRLLSSGTWAGWTYEELVGYGFKEGDSCWVSIDIEAGVTNHESGDNFTLTRSGPMASYSLGGSTWTPSWSLN
ncbi:hypothetical protein DB88DRAFT_495810 [Papiliotrema laurentii]|jgi:hypothetical protein|uniref:Uncharacterized protein n=1 Tax=Papiliotrema laurentii TaxID=5418 RepID=A0AAD9CW67_PAPLA|nr:hypothetical protein DB88DRAFT_495810 [Papiliotrema laurentii]